MSFKRKNNTISTNSSSSTSSSLTTSPNGNSPTTTTTPAQTSYTTNQNEIHKAQNISQVLIHIIQRLRVSSIDSHQALHFLVGGGGSTVDWSVLKIILDGAIPDCPVDEDSGELGIMTTMESVTTAWMGVLETVILQLGGYGCTPLEDEDDEDEDDEEDFVGGGFNFDDDIKGESSNRISNGDDSVNKEEDYVEVGTGTIQADGEETSTTDNNNNNSNNNNADDNSSSSDTTDRLLLEPPKKGVGSRRDDVITTTSPKQQQQPPALPTLPTLPRKFIASSKYLTILLPNKFLQLKKHLKFNDKTEKWLVTNQAGDHTSRLGTSRLKLLRIVESLVLLSDDGVDVCLHDSGVILDCLDIFFRFEYCAMAQQAVANLLVHLIEGSASVEEEVRRSGTFRQKLFKSIIFDYDLLGKLIATFERNELSIKGVKAKRLGLMGHVIIICQAIVDLAVPKNSTFLIQMPTQTKTMTMRLLLPRKKRLLPILMRWSTQRIHSLTP